MQELDRCSSSVRSVAASLPPRSCISAVPPSDSTSRNRHSEQPSHQQPLRVYVSRA